MLLLLPEVPVLDTLEVLLELAGVVLEEPLSELLELLEFTGLTIPPTPYIPRFLTKPNIEKERRDGVLSVSPTTRPRLLQELEQQLRSGIGLCQHRRRRLLDDLVLREVHYLLSHIRVAYLALRCR
ncbi:hypothetical protein CTKA_02870 [Chthonomonas calidirosea]|uniref:Uncharacterized protein n=1 Tax=Chthonomonas calidirosea (strain DSM 23976 / ICMP 18418 / T49) TaxID=1303518 RepID=S0EU02_CHTCT|nr:hypothetical protein CCALI_01231 [Chthonomonas calidirosea T49]CEK20466.1 hypothetical protein CP488_02866 [Chthonomonas calidirosea]CEK20936.1 hypothetical protein CTKA_02870 [Chthonomonas calidirosea]